MKDKLYIYIKSKERLGALIYFHLKSFGLFCMGNIILLSPVLSETSFEHPLRVEPVAVYSKIRVDGNYSENHQLGNFQRERNLSLEGEIKFLKHFSLKAGGGRTRYEQTNSRNVELWDRWNLGLKFGMVHGGDSFRIGWGGGIRIYDKFVGTQPLYEVAPNYYLVRPNLSFGVGIGKLEIVMDGSFQSETTSNFREGPRDEFRRFHQLGLSISYGVTDSIRIFGETEYRKGYDKKVDTLVDAWYFYPGISFKPYEQGRISASFQMPVSKQDYLVERGVRLSYFHFFEF